MTALPISRAGGTAATLAFMETNESKRLRKLILNAMDGHESHIAFDAAVGDFPAELRGMKPSGAPHTAWQLLEHMRITQRDILDFSRDTSHESPPWPEGYWPSTEAPPDEHAWDRSAEAFRNDAREVRKLIQNPAANLLEPLEGGDGQTLLREVLLIATHTSYHLGQLVFLKKTLLGKS